MPELDRDRSVEHVLRQVLSQRLPGSSQNACPDAETIAAWHEGSLRADEAAAIQHHIADCTRCRALTAAFIASIPADPPVESLWRRWHLGWAVPLATAATAALLWIAIPDNNPLPPASTPAAGRDSIRPAGPLEAPSAPSAPAPQRSAPASAEVPKAIAPAGNEESRFAAEAQPRRTQLPEAQAEADAASTTRIELDKRESAAVASAPRPSALARQVTPQAEIIAPGGVARWRIVGGKQVERWTSTVSGWGLAEIDSAETLTAGAAPSSSVCWLVGRRGAVYVTVDGTSFMRLPFPEMADLVAVTATDDRTATVSASDGRSWQTTDRGASWSMPD